MKLQVPFSGPGRGSSPVSNKAFTLPELLIAMTVFILMLAGIVSANLFGLRMFQFNSTKLNATDWSRRTFGQITDEIRSCNSFSILNVDTNGNFTGLLDGEMQQGNALQIYPTTNTSSYTIYFVNLPDATFRRRATAPGGSKTFILADSITNSMVFSAQDRSGNVLTNNQNNQMIHLMLEFYQTGRFMQRPDYYKLETSVTRRALQ
jgi:type II secretory pathway pseudopilin PulG